MDKVKNILAFRNDRFGEFLLNIPAFNALKTAYPLANLVLIANPVVAELAACIKSVDEVIPWKNKKHSLKEILRFSRELKKRKFECCVIFNPSKEFNILSFLAQIPLRIGYNRKWGFLLNKRIEDKKYLGLKHEVEYNLELASLTGADIRENNLSLNIDECIIDEILRDSKLHDDPGFIVLHPFTSDPIKQWPLNNFCALARKICAETAYKVVIVGGNEELERNAELFNNLGNGVVNLTGKTTLVQLAALLKKSRLLISGDSGPVHLACAVGTQVIAIFRNDLPGKAAKRWGPWGQGHSVIAKINLCDVTVEEVFNKFKDIVLKDKARV